METPEWLLLTGKKHDEESEKKAIYETRVGNICKVIVKLKDSSYKDKIMKECKEYFYDKNFSATNIKGTESTVELKINF